VKPAGKILRNSAILIVIAALPLLAYVAYSVSMSGPLLTAYPGDGSVRIEGRFLGEYVLGFERLKIQAGSTSRIVCDLEGHWSSDLELRGGVNTVATMFPRDRSRSTPDSTRECRLARGQRYRVTVWGNNGWGHVRPASIDVEF
jgi:hypothetical protein